MRFCKSRISWRMTAPLWTHFRSWQSYPYFFVFPFYCLLKIRNFPDIALLFLLQLLDFLRDRSKTRRQKAGNRLTKKLKIAGMPKNEKSQVLKSIYVHSFTVSDISTKSTLLKTILLSTRWLATKLESFIGFLCTSTNSCPKHSLFHITDKAKKEVQLQIIFMKVLFLLVSSEPVWPETLVFLQVRNLSRE